MSPIYSRRTPCSFFFFTEELGKYEVEGDALQSYAEFQLAATVYGALIEGAASEQSARMQAMENATKNAGMLHGPVVFSAALFCARWGLDICMHAC